jgi:hypothetical protein
MYQQLNIFDQKRGQELAQVGLELAVDTANAEFPKWSERCWQLFWQWLNKKPRYYRFMIEDFREHIYKMDLIERPKSDRAFGFLSSKAVRLGMIISGGTAKVKNQTAHCANAGVWIKN